MNRSTWLVPCCVVLAIAGGCRAKENPDAVGAEPKEQVRAADAQPQGAPEKGTSGDEAGGADPDLAVLTIVAVDIDTKLAALCEVPDSKLFFKFDSSNLRPEAKELLDRIATCAKTGAAKGKGLHVVGRTDPRGTAEYNQELGKQRAETVADYLRAQGVAEARVEAMSRGEAQASPDDPWRWPYDRRVTVRLGDGDAPAVR